MCIRDSRICEHFLFGRQKNAGRDLVTKLNRILGSMRRGALIIASQGAKGPDTHLPLQARWRIFLVILLSLLVALTNLPPLILLLGPEGRQGEITPLYWLAERLSRARRGQAPPKKADAAVGEVPRKGSTPNLVFGAIFCVEGRKRRDLVTKTKASWARSVGGP